MLKKIITRLILILGLVFVLVIASCKTDADTETKAEPEPPVEVEELNTGLRKHEFRAVWIATAFHVDMQRQPSEDVFRHTFNTMLNTCELYNMNAVIFQVSPMLDSFWPSQHRPWSNYLYSTRQGNGPLWNPLAIMVEETHKRGMEFHAWLNPYRVLSDVNIQGDNTQASKAFVLNALRENRTLAESNFAVKNPGLVFRHNNIIYLDPGFPEVITHIVDTVKEIIENYDVDAIHFDDYFYPSGTPGDTSLALDQTSFSQHGAGFGTTGAGREAWRRRNNDNLIESVLKAIRDENEANGKTIQFGISPAGTWSSNQSIGGSNTGAGVNQTYSGGTYADTRKWVLDEMVDYMAPQIYWEQTHTTANYNILSTWWAGVHENKNVHLYIGHANYKYMQNHAQIPWQQPEEILNQLIYNQDYPNIRGSIFYSYKDSNRFTGTAMPGAATLIEANKLILEFWNHPVIVPPLPWLGDTVPSAPVNVVRNGNTITWNDTEENNSRYYVVYRITKETDGSNNPALVIQDPGKIIARVWRNGTQTVFTDKTTASPSYYTYIVTALSGSHIESEPAVAN